MHVDLREYSFLSNWLLRSGIYGNSHPLVFKIGNLFLLLCTITATSIVFLVWWLLAIKLDFLGLWKKQKIHLLLPLPWATSTVSETSGPTPQNLIITLPRLLCTFWTSKAMSQQCLMSSKANLFSKPCSVLLLSFYSGFTLPLKCLHLYNTVSVWLKILRDEYWIFSGMTIPPYSYHKMVSGAWWGSLKALLILFYFLKLYFLKFYLQKKLVNLYKE